VSLSFWKIANVPAFQLCLFI